MNTDTDLPDLPDLPNGATAVLVVDICAVTLQRTGDDVVALLPDGVALAHVRAADGEDARTTAARALDRCLDARVQRPAMVGGSAQLVGCQVLLYNPVTALTARRDAQTVLVHGSGRPVLLEEDGTVGFVDGAVLHVAGAELAAIDLDGRDVPGEVDAHRFAPA